MLRDFVEVNIDNKMMGVAGVDSWGDQPRPEHTIPSNMNYSFGFSFVPISKSSDIDEKLVFIYE